MDWQKLLITVFIYISDRYEDKLQTACQRLSNNFKPVFTDEEVITVFLFGIMQKRFKIKDIHNYACNHLKERFPLLPSYTAFVQRLNRPENLFYALFGNIIQDFAGSSPEILQKIRLIDSFPVISAGSERSSYAKVAHGFADKGYCSSKGIYCYGVKLHVLAISRPGTIPLPECTDVTPASGHDLNFLRQISPHPHGCGIYADKAYIDEAERQILKENCSEIHIPVKKRKGQKTLSFYEQLLSSGVSRVRQPIESFFNWLEEKTEIRTASKVRSYKGLMVHIFGRLSAAMFMLTFNS